MENITIKNDKWLKELADITGKNEIELIERLSSRLVKAGIVDDELMSCGTELSEFIDLSGHKTSSVALFVLSKSTQKINMVFEKLTVWGKDDECELCGCHLVDDKSYSSGKNCVNPCCNYNNNFVF